VIAFVAVVAQGVLGGLRVTLYKQELGIFHAALAQLFLLCVCAIALFLSPLWRKLVEVGPSVRFHHLFRPFVLAGACLIFLQLVLGATMRHQHAGLAVPDFPLAYGQFWPRTDDAFLEEVNQKRMDYRDFQPITAAQIYLHMAHRINAVIVLAAVLGAMLFAGKGQSPAPIRTFARGWFGIILLQAFLGAYTVWSNKAADVATAHVAIGAISLVWGGLLFIATSPLAARESAGESVAASLPEGSPA
jgi:cytochrome c oxidase assembly protein subunit 15